jgi:hypothetical protein
MTAMNVPTMLADFLELVTPKNMHKSRMKSLCAVTQSLISNGEYTGCTIERGIQKKPFNKGG